MVHGAGCEPEPRGASRGVGAGAGNRQNRDGDGTGSRARGSRAGMDREAGARTGDVKQPGPSTRQGGEGSIRKQIQKQWLLHVLLVQQVSKGPLPEAAGLAEAEEGDSLWDFLDCRVGATQGTNSTTADATVEVQRYLSEAYLPRGEDPLKYWESRKDIYPHLHRMAIDYLHIPATSVPCEQVFSKAGEVVRQKRRSKPRPAPNSVSLKSDRSKDPPPKFREAPPEDQREPGPKEQLDAIFRCLEEQVLRFVQQQLQRFHRLLASDYPECSESEEEESREVLNITLDFLKRMDQEHLTQRLFNRSNVGVCRDKLKSDLQQRLSHVFEGVAKAGDSAPLTQINTELYITEGRASEVNQEHEVRHMETASRRPAAPETTITCEDLFKPHSPEPIRFVLTKGVAGVGKTVLTQKLSLDWAEGHAHQDLQLLFPFTFRALSVLRDTQFSLVGLLHHFFSPSKDLCSFQQLQVLFIFDGLDECRPPLDFSRTRVLTDPTESASVHQGESASLRSPLDNHTPRRNQSDPC
ncbi:uncharacterized protein LOC129456267 [Periophthalmus magnuspinnatus]|uniref:uncharacterized protein LOC129456267 n=1 Tax=Periophthalmus magnuspinnatus TaxID=409849 RepID=UPI00243636AA|nr:uncharacterized protein LOC129456267 [Periophthalmus magnuspinnatus]